MAGLSFIHPASCLPDWPRPIKCRIRGFVPSIAGEFEDPTDGHSAIHPGSPQFPAPAKKSPAASGAELAFNCDTQRRALLTVFVIPGSWRVVAGTLLEVEG